MKFSKREQKEKRQRRVRASISGTPIRPRLSVSRSLLGMYVQLIDDVSGKTLASANSKKDAAGATDAGERKGKVAVAYALGKVLAQKASAAGITTVVFDRAGYSYAGRVQAVADGARDGGLLF